MNLALEATPQERQRSINLNVGYETAGNTWEVLVRYQGSLDFLQEEKIPVTYLLGNYAILTVPATYIDTLASLPQITYVEKPKRLYYSAYQGRSISCINPLQRDTNGLFGEGIFVACIDSGIDYTHPDFRNADGSTRIFRLWDQSISSGQPPAGYQIGSEYTKEQIDAALLRNPSLVPSRDNSGHGTAVLGIAAGNGAASDGIYRGVAPQSTLIVVKLGSPGTGDFPRTTQLLQGIDYVIRLSLQFQIPVAVNLSFGNNYGSHSGDSLLEEYLNTVSALGQNVICVGSGNEGNSANHTSGTLLDATPASVEFSIGPYTASLGIQLWKSYSDEFDLYLQYPDGTTAGPIQPVSGIQRLSFSGTDLLIFYGMPAPFAASQEIYFDFLPSGQNPFLVSGIWRFLLIPRRIVSGEYHFWLPGGNITGNDTGFLTPTPDTTLTIPSTAFRALTVGAYDSRLLAYADFSGRGYTRILQSIKPDLAAPGVSVTAPNAGSGPSYAEFTGTSFATPFVTGSAALMMEWGILRGNDPFLYGEKVKAFLRKGARPLPGFSSYPNPQIGYGVLCLQDSFPL